MGKIHELVQQTLTDGYLTVETENQLRQLLQTTKYSWKDIDAFTLLQQAVMAGEVQQESRELKVL